MGCSVGCLQKQKKKFKTPLNLEIISQRISCDYKIMFQVVDLLQLPELIKVSRVNRRMYFLTGRLSILKKFNKSYKNNKQNSGENNWDISNTIQNTLQIYSYQKIDMKKDVTQDKDANSILQEVPQLQIMSGVDKTNIAERSYSFIDQDKQYENQELLENEIFLEQYQQVQKQNKLTSPSNKEQLTSSKSTQLKSKRVIMMLDFVVDEEGYFAPQYLPFQLNGENSPVKYQKLTAISSPQKSHHSRQLTEILKIPSQFNTGTNKMQISYNTQKLRDLQIEMSSDGGYDERNLNFFMQTPNFNVISASKRDSSQNLRKYQDQEINGLQNQQTNVRNQPMPLLTVTGASQQRIENFEASEMSKRSQFNASNNSLIHEVSNLNHFGQLQNNQYIALINSQQNQMGSGQYSTGGGFNNSRSGFQGAQILIMDEDAQQYSNIMENQNLTSIQQITE
eukprot:403370437